MPEGRAAEVRPSVSFVVLNWNGKEVLDCCLTSIGMLTYPIQEIVVVDNASTDGSLDLLREKYAGRVTVICNSSNLGTAARNRGLRHAVETGVDFVFSLDNDLTIAPDAIDVLVGVMHADPRIAIAGALILDQARPELIHSAGHMMNWTQNLVRTLGAGQVLRGQFRGVWNVDYIGAGHMLVRAEFMARHGYPDEAFIGYGYEDTDFGMRARSLGWRVVCCADAKVWHRPHTGIGRYSFKKKYLETRNAIVFMKRYGTWLRWSKYLVFLILGVVYAFFREGVRGNLPGVIGKIRGAWDGLWNREDFAWNLLREGKR